MRSRRGREQRRGERWSFHGQDETVGAGQGGGERVLRRRREDRHAQPRRRGEDAHPRLRQSFAEDERIRHGAQAKSGDGSSV